MHIYESHISMYSTTRVLHIMKFSLGICLGVKNPLPTQKTTNPQKPPALKKTANHLGTQMTLPQNSTSGPWRSRTRWVKFASLLGHVRKLRLHQVH